MEVQVQKWGKSLALKIPKSFALEFSVEEGALVDLSVVEGKLVITPVAHGKYTLEELLDGVTTCNIHREIDAVQSVGKDVW